MPSANPPHKIPFPDFAVITQKKTAAPLRAAVFALMSFAVESGHSHNGTPQSTHAEIR